jgi:hypothetical protein
MFCLDEDVIYDGNVGRLCPACGSQYVMPVSRWLNRNEPEPATVTPAALLLLCEELGIDTGSGSW